MGLERMAAILQGVDNLYEIDSTRPILDRAAQLSGQRYGADAEHDVRLRVVADHSRAATMLIGDGVTPSNEEAGYVLRRILRRIVRNMRLLGAHGPTLHELVATTIEVMAPQYPELARDAARIHAVADGEETSFFSTLQAGTTRFEVAARDAQAAAPARDAVLSGDQAFALHDTYGFPIDLTLEMAAEQGLQVDEDGFRRLMDEQRQRAKADSRRKKTGAVDVSAYRAVLDTLGEPVLFTGYPTSLATRLSAACLSMGRRSARCATGQQVELVLNRTPFYAEGGGQLADAGVITFANGAVVEVDDVQQPLPGLIVHRGRVRLGEAVVGYSGIRRDRSRAPPGHFPSAHRDPHGAQGVSRGTRRVGDPSRLGERTGSVPIRLRQPGRGACLGARRRRGPRQRRSRRRPCGDGRGHEPVRRRRLGGDGPVR